MEKFVVGFLFSHNLEEVVLIKKAKPLSQKGRLNGVGGKIEQGESSNDAISREFYEEAGCFISPDDWLPFFFKTYKNRSIQFFASQTESLNVNTAETKGELVVVKKLDSNYKIIDNDKLLNDIPSLIIRAIKLMLANQKKN